jgi:hypothetical protein
MFLKLSATIPYVSPSSFVFTLAIFIFSPIYE